MVDKGLLPLGRQNQGLAFGESQANAVHRTGRGTLPTGGFGNLGDAVDVVSGAKEESALYPQGGLIDGVAGIDKDVGNQGGEDDEQGQPYPQCQVYHQGIAGEQDEDNECDQSRTDIGAVAGFHGESVGVWLIRRCRRRAGAARCLR